MNSRDRLLAIQSYGSGFVARDPGVGLNLALTLDEQEWLDVDLRALMGEELTRETGAQLPNLDHYMLEDPYADRLLGDAVRRAFGLLAENCVVFAGAGVDSLLHALAPLARPKGAAPVGPVYPDLPRWVDLAGLPCRALTFEEAFHASASLILLERPSWSSPEPGISKIAELCEALESRDAWLLVDESYANYAPLNYSAAPLVLSHRNLIVVRGFSKAYWLGGLRVGACIASRSAEQLLKDLIPPLLASSLSLALCRKLIELGDITARLRRRIEESRIEASEALEKLGLPPPSAASELLPAFIWHEGGTAISRALAKHSIATKLQPFWGTGDQVSRSCRMSIPLSSERMALLRALLGMKEGLRNG